MRGLSVLPPKSETFKLFHIKSQKFPWIIQAQELYQNILIPTSIAFQPETWLRVLNTSDLTKFITTDAVKASNIDDFDIMKIDKSNRKSIRQDESSKLLSTRKPTHALNKLLPLYIICLST